MVKKKDNNYYISKVIIHLENVVSFLRNVDYDTFYKRKILQSAVCFELIQIYENANNITDDILLTINNFPLHELRGLRNRLVHEYGNVDYSIIYKTAVEDIPLLLKQLKSFSK